MTEDSVDVSRGVRPGRPEDAAALRAVELDADQRYEAFGLAPTEEADAMPVEAAQRAIAEERLWVVEVDGAVVGFAYVGRVGGELCLGQLSVARAQGRKGYGGALLDRVLEEARRRGEPSVQLNTQSDVPWNAPWYERRGFVVVPEARWTSAMRALTENQQAHGLSWTRRVHMRCRIKEGGEGSVSRRG